MAYEPRNGIISHAPRISHACLACRLVRSITLFEHLIPDKTHPVWVSWVKHVEYVDLMLNKTEYTLADIVRLDMAVYEATKQFNKVQEYKGFFKPKQHLAAHASVNTLRMGPMRGCASCRASYRHSRLASACAPCMRALHRIHAHMHASHNMHYSCLVLVQVLGILF
jgi:hypothetical protein